MRRKTDVTRPPSGQIGVNERRLTTWATVGAVICSFSVLTFAALLYGTPNHFGSIFGELEQASVKQFQQALHVRILAPMSNPGFALWFRLIVGLAWAGYGMAVLSGFYGARIRPGRALLLIACLSTAVAVFCPPSLSTDPYAYVAWARLKAVYGRNPYVDNPDVLRALGDSTAPFLRWSITSPYGSVWTVFSTGLIALLRSAGLWWQLVAMKLIEAAALVAAAAAGKQIADRLSPGRGDLTMLAIGLNPLLLVEGPGTGHNDILMMSLTLVGMAFCLRKRSRVGFVFFGLSTGVKFLTGAFVPWMMIQQARGTGLRRGMAQSVILAALALCPIVLCYLPLWHSWDTLTGALGRSTMVSAGSAAASSPQSLAQVGSIIAGQWPLLALFVLLTLWVLQSKDPGAGLTAWTALSLYMAVFLLAIQFPWYFTWPLIVSLTRWNKTHVCLSFACCVLGSIQMLRYSLTV